MNLTKNKKIALVSLTLIVCLCGTAFGFYLGAITGTTNVYESITWTPASFGVIDIYAGDVRTQDITIYNAANQAILVTVTVTDNSDWIVATAPSGIWVPAQNSVALTVTITALQSAPLGIYCTVTVALDR